MPPDGMSVGEYLRKIEENWHSAVADTRSRLNKLEGETGIHHDQLQKLIWGQNQASSDRQRLWHVVQKFDSSSNTEQGYRLQRIEEMLEERIAWERWATQVFFGAILTGIAAIAVSRFFGQ